MGCLFSVSHSWGGGYLCCGVWIYILHSLYLLPFHAHHTTDNRSPGDNRASLVLQGKRGSIRWSPAVVDGGATLMLKSVRVRLYREWSYKVYGGWVFIMSYLSILCLIPFYVRSFAYSPSWTRWLFLKEDIWKVC